MPSSTYKCRVLVLKKTKLGESDLILTCLKDDGSQLRAVAKGARKPKNSFSARLDVFAVDDVLIARGKNLDIISEARIVSAHMPLREDIVRAAAASAVLGALDKTTQQDLPVPRLFDMTVSALDHMAVADAEEGPAFTAAFLLKLFCMLGVRPSFDACAVCGNPLNPSQISGGLAFSFSDGGAVCDRCRGRSDCMLIDARTCSWASALMQATFDDIAAMHVEPATSFSVLELCRGWCRQNLGTNVKALDYLMSCGLF